MTADSDDTADDETQEAVVSQLTVALSAARSGRMDIAHESAGAALKELELSGEHGFGADDATFLTNEEYGLLLEALNNYNQEIGGADYEEEEFRDHVGVEKGALVEDLDRGITPDAVQYNHLSAEDDRFEGLAEKIERAGGDLDGSEWFVCSCGNVAMPSDPMNHERDRCGECGSEIPFFGEQSEVIRYE